MSQQWSYSSNTGPDHWGDLNPDWAVAATGKAQSPINIIADSDSPRSRSIAELHFTATDFVIGNTGHTVEIVPATTGNHVVLDGMKYTFRQAHFHAPSEHRLNGRSFVMEMHLIGKDDAGHIAVIGLVITLGAENATLRKVFAQIPTTPTDPADKYEMTKIDLSNLIPANSRTFRYAGSLTTPPCTEGVTWLVYETPIQLSAAQIKAFTGAYSMNARPVQALNGRTISVGQ